MLREVVGKRGLFKVQRGFFQLGMLRSAAQEKVEREQGSENIRGFQEVLPRKRRRFSRSQGSEAKSGKIV